MENIRSLLVGKFQDKRFALLGMAVAAVWLIADYLTKQWALSTLEANVIHVIDGLLNWRLAFNRGVAFSFMANWDYTHLQYALAALAFGVATGMLYWLTTDKDKLFQIGVGSIIGGAIGNGIDRLTMGAVIDFIDVYQGNWHFPTFNVADIAINVGVALIILQSILLWKRSK